MDFSIGSGAAALLGSFVGGAATLATAWMTQRSMGRREHAAAEVKKREALYGDFVA